MEGGATRKELALRAAKLRTGRLPPTNRRHHRNDWNRRPEVRKRQAQAWAALYGPGPHCRNGAAHAAGHSGRTGRLHRSRDAGSWRGDGGGAAPPARKGKGRGITALSCAESETQHRTRPGGTGSSIPVTAPDARPAYGRRAGVRIREREMPWKGNGRAGAQDPGVPSAPPETSARGGAASALASSEPNSSEKWCEALRPRATRVQPLTLRLRERGAR